MSQLQENAYQQLSRELEDAPMKASPAEAQGLLCGLICAGVSEAEARWVREILGDEDQGVHQTDLGLDGLADLSSTLPLDLPEPLRALAERTQAEMAGEDLTLTLMLPAEDRPLRERAEGLYDWARGFLLGLGLGGLSERGLSAQGRELLGDLVELTRLDLDALATEDEEGEDDESALVELQEFLWVAVRLMQVEAGQAEQAGITGQAWQAGQAGQGRPAGRRQARES